MPERKKDLCAGDAEASHQDRRAARALNNEGTDASKSPRDLVTEQRKRLRDTGFAPIPVSGKRPAILEWEKKTDVTDAEIETWREHKGTGLLTRRMPALDIDIYNPEAAKAIEALVRARFQGRGKVLVRVGNAPKCAIPFRTDRPFKKITANLIAPEDDTILYRRRGGVMHPMVNQKIELLCDGQQLVVFGIHPDTRKQYQWIGGEPGEVSRDELPEITEVDARQLVDDVAQLLCDRFGYTRRRQTATVNPEGGQDWSRLLANILAGADLHNSTRDLAAKLIVSGTGAGTAVNLVRAVMEQSTAPRDARWQARFDDIPRAVTSAQEKFDDTAEITLEPHAFPDEASIGRWDFLYGRHLLRQTVSATAAMGSTGKSSMGIVEALALASGFTDRELAELFDVSLSTIEKWRRQREEFRNVLKIGKAEADKRVERSLYERATGYSYNTVKIFRDKNGKVIKVPYVEHVPPDVTAQIFWLKNRDPARWRDAWQVEAVTGKYIISDRPMTEEEWIRERATMIDVTPEKADEYE